jgi:hypothetical protein
VPVFRRSSDGAAEGTAQGSQGTQTPEAPPKTKSPAQTGKGRPTPKRSAAEANRYRTITGSTTSGRGRPAAGDPKRKLTPEERARVREDRSKQMQAMRRGEDWALSARDKGPAKKLTRDYVDAHRRPMEFYMYALIVLVLGLVAGRASSISRFTTPFLIAVIAVIVVDGYLLRRSILKVVQERLPDASTRGLAVYAIMRALQLRRFRAPAPAVKPGDDF